MKEYWWDVGSNSDMGSESKNIYIPLCAVPAML